MESVKQVVIAHYSLPPVIGGVENMMVPLAELFAQHGYLVNLLAGEGYVEGQNIQTSIIPDFSPNSPHTLNMQRVLQIGSLPENYEFRLQSIQREIETKIGNIETVIIHNILTMPFNLVVTEAFWNYIRKHPEKKFFVWVHDLAWQMEEYQNMLYDKKPWSILKTSLPQVNYITVSEARKRQISDLMGIQKRRITVVPNVLKYADFFRFDAATPELIGAVNWFHNDPIVLIPARIIPRKNLELSIRMIKALQKKFPRILAVITGAFPNTDNIHFEYAQMLRKLIEDSALDSHILLLHDWMERLKIAKERNRHIVRDLYFISDLVLLLSRDEGFGLPILEAGAVRVPLAISRIAAFREVTTEGICSLNLADRLETNVAKLVQLLQEHRSGSSQLFRKIFEKYNWDCLWDHYLCKVLAEPDD